MPRGGRKGGHSGLEAEEYRQWIAGNGPGRIPVPNVEIYLELLVLQQQPKYPIVSVSCTFAVVIFRILFVNGLQK